MNNLKRVLSLALASVMVIGMMVVGASAFSDDADIENKDAVGTMTALNIINGYPDGSYKPEELLLREQAAKMVFVALNGGKTSENLTTKTVPTFSDIKGNWAEGYIEWAYNRGILAGMGDGTFNPKGNLTGTQLAKVMLVAIGYNAKAEGLEGTNDWALNVNALALQKGFFEGLDDLDPEANITRDQAAQLILNACNAPMVEYNSYLQTVGGVLSSTLVAQNKKDGGNNNVTILSDKYSINTYEGVLVATGKYDLTAVLAPGAIVSGTAGAKKFVVAADTLNGAEITEKTYAFSSTEDLTEYMGQYVKVMANATTGALLGVFPAEDTNKVLVTDTSKVTLPATGSVKFDGTTYSYDVVNNTVALVVANGEALGTLADLNTTGHVDKVVFVDNDGDDSFDVALITPVDVYQVNFINSTTVTLVDTTTIGSLANGLSQTLTDIEAPEGLKKNDYVTATRHYFNDKDVLEVVEKKTATIAGTKQSGGTLNKWQIDGSWMDKAAGATFVSTNLVSGSSIEYVSVGTKLFYAKLNSEVETSKDLAMIYQIAAKPDTFGAYTTEAKIILADGTKSTVTVGGLYPTPADAAGDTNDALTNNAAIATGTSDPEAAYVGVLTTYTINNDGEYVFTLLSNTNKAGYDTVSLTAAATYGAGSTSTIAGKAVADDAVILLFASGDATETAKNITATNAATILSGKEFKTLAAAKYVAASQATALVSKDSNGFERVRVASVVVTSETGTGSTTDGYNYTDAKWNLGVTASGSNYGYLIDSWQETVSGTKYNVYKFWNGSETVTLKEKNSTASTLAKRTIFTYDVVDSETIKNVKTPATPAQTGAVVAYNDTTVGIAQTSSMNGEAKITNDTVIFNINDASIAGVEGNSITPAIETITAGQYADNCYVIVSGNEVKFIAVDSVKNRLADVDITASAVSEVNGLFAAGYDVTYGSNLTAGTYDLNGQTLTLTGNIQSGAVLTGGGSIVVTGNVADTADIATAVAATTDGETIKLPEADVSVTSISGTVGSGTSAFGAGDLDGSSLFQFSVPAANFAVGAKVTRTYNGTTVTLNSTMSTADDIYQPITAATLKAGGTMTFTVYKDGNTGNTAAANVFSFTVTW